MKYSDYTPVKVDEGVYTIAIPVEVCPKCNGLMTFVSHSGLASQMGRAKIEHMAPDMKSCRKCYQRWLQENFECYLCKRSHPMSAAQFKYDQRDEAYLCENCYRTVTAEVWDDAISKIHGMCDWTD